MPHSLLGADAAKKETAIVTGGSEELLVVCDFDRTLTKAFVDNKVTSLISVMFRERIFDEDYMQKARAAYEKYRPIEIDESLSPEYRSKQMQHWWEYVSQLLIEKGLSKTNLRAAIAKTKTYIRPGAIEFLTKLSQKNIPLVILSAGGLGTESIQYFLEMQGINFSNIKIFSNNFIWDETGTAIDYVRPLVHSFNKDFQLIKNDTSYFQTISHRQNVILVGDSPSDLDMAKNCSYEHLLKVGFLNENVAQLRADFQRLYDVVIENDGPMDYLCQLIDKIA